jgi:hypothetical protein
MHILADLGFDGVYPIYWIKESKHAITYILVNMHEKAFKNQKRCNLSKTPSKPRYAHQSVTRHKVVQILSKIQINTWKEIPIETKPNKLMIDKILIWKDTKWK